MARRAEPRFQIGANESAIGLFDDHGFFAGGRRFGLETAARLVGAVVGPGICGVVANMHHRPSLRTPVRQQSHNLLFGIGIVTRPPIGMIDRLLQINQQQDCTIRGCIRGAYVATGLSGANNPTAGASA
jgi:hypothetical protein